MSNSLVRLRALTVIGFLGLVACVMAASTATTRGEEPKTNACGCFQTTAGECICTRKSKCDCPGECEPKGCDEKRQKELEKEIKEETRKAEAAEKKRQQEAAEKQRKAEAQAAEDGDQVSVNDTEARAQEEDRSSESKGKGKEKDRKNKKAEGPRSDAP
jgi:type IV secretory pathway VirB10-like protein